LNRLGVTRESNRRTDIITVPRFTTLHGKLTTNETKLKTIRKKTSRKRETFKYAKFRGCEQF